MESMTPAPSPSPAEVAAAAVSLRFLFHWLGVRYHLFPPVGFLVTKDWKKVFHDCFGPEVLVADTITTVVILWYNIFGPRKTDSVVSIIIHTLGIGMNLMSMCLFAMYHSLCGGIKRAVLWYYIGLAAFATVTLLTFMWMDMGVTVENENRGSAFAGYMRAAAAAVFQVLWPGAIRLIDWNSVNDEKPVFWLKISATTISIVVSLSDLWYMIEENYWATEIERRFIVLSVINIVGGFLQLIARFIGPETIMKPAKRFIDKSQERCTEQWEQCKNLFWMV